MLKFLAPCDSILKYIHSGVILICPKFFETLFQAGQFDQCLWTFFVFINYDGALRLVSVYRYSLYNIKRVVRICAGVWICLCFYLTKMLNIKKNVYIILIDIICLCIHIYILP